MSVTLKQDEAMPAAWPEIAPYPHWEWPEETGDAPLDPYGNAVIDPALIWQRLESWITWRWGERQVVWTVEGRGDEWCAPLTPATFTKVELWLDNQWNEITVQEGPLGGLLLTNWNHFRITATVGSTDDPPEIVQEAWRRLHEYSRGVAEAFKEGGADYRDDSGQRVASWTAKSMQLSGAADLLRQYRRAR